jgi:hypothetical protein
VVVNLRLATLLSLPVLAVAGAATVSAAPDPASGEVSAAAPTTSFAGSITEPTGAYEINAQSDGTTKDNCVEPVCQEYALKVKDASTLLTVDSVVDDDGFSQTVEIETPDGAITQTSATDPGTVKAKLKNPKAGDYLIRIYGSDYINESPSWTYKATVTLGTGSTTPAGPAPTPAPTTTTPPSGGSGGSTPTPAAPKLTIAKPKVSAKKANKAKSVTVKLITTAPVNGLQLTFSTGKATKPKLAGSAKLGRLEGTKPLKVKLKGKLKPGSLRILARGTDDQGRAVSAQVSVKVKK